VAMRTDTSSIATVAAAPSSVTATLTGRALRIAVRSTTLSSLELKEESVS
jgi:hypothetical protein